MDVGVIHCLCMGLGLNRLLFPNMGEFIQGPDDAGNHTFGGLIILH